jgi:hypothetical protein
MEARNRRLPEWFNRIRTGQVRLPRFQRFEAWGHDRVSGLIETVLRGLPAGATLVLEIGDKELFKSRPMVGAPDPTERATEHLLDGQQRITALWRAFNDRYDDRTYFVKFEEDEDHPGQKVAKVYGQPRWERGGKRYPLWADDVSQVYSREFLPLRLLRPGDVAVEIDTWCEKAVGRDPKAILELSRRIQLLREAVSNFDLPFLSLPAGTPKDVALDVFIKMNTSAVPLTAFDVVVAQVEEETGQSLHDLLAQLEAGAPAVRAYEDPSQLILGTAALREDRPPTQASFGRLALQRLVNEWQDIVDGIAFAVEFLGEERVFDSARLPTSAILPVLASIHAFIPETLDARGNAMTLIRKYLWRAFVTNRYENQAATRQLQDMRGLCAVLREGQAQDVVPALNEVEFPLPTTDQLLRAGWPKTRDILARGILAVALRGGALDLADGTLVSRDRLRGREYHHLFPDSLLTGIGGLEPAESYRALNCALITWNTNRNILAKEPVQYLRERVDRATLGETEVRARLLTHAVPFDALNVGGYAQIADGSTRASRIRSDYEAFLRTRAELRLKIMIRLCNGEQWPTS